MSGYVLALALVAAGVTFGVRVWPEVDRVSPREVEQAQRDRRLGVLALQSSDEVRHFPTSRRKPPRPGRDRRPRFGPTSTH